MKSPLPTWLPLAGVLLVAAGVLGAVMFGLAGGQSGRIHLPGTGGHRVELLADPTRALTIDEVTAREAGEWKPAASEAFIRAGAREATWIRVTLRNPSSQPQRGVLGESGYYTDTVDFWERDTAVRGGWRHEQSGEWTRHKPVWGRNAVFAVELPARAERTFYLRAEDHFGLLLDLAWWPDREQLEAAKLRTALSEGVYYGALFALFFYNAVLWVRLRFSDTGYYLGYLGAAALFFFSVNGGFPQFLTAVGSPMIDTIIVTTLTLSAASLAQFGRVFLELRERAPRADRLARWVRNAVLLSLPIAFATPWLPAMLWLPCLVVSDFAIHLMMLAMAVVAWRAGATQARYFVLAFGFLFAGLLPLGGALLLINPQKWKLMGFLVGSGMEMLVLSLAVADRFTRIQRERTAAQERLVEEMAQREAIQEAYADELELEVNERTKELKQANQDKDRMIAVIGHDLRGPLTALTMGAEQAAGRAGEALEFTQSAAHTGRQVLLLIEDLVLWARMRAGSVHPGEHDVQDFVSQVVALHQPLAAQRGVRLAVAVPDSLRVKTDFVLAQTLTRNLVANAVRFARSQVVVGGAAVPGGVRVTVSDDGPGLPQKAGAVLAAAGGAAEEANDAREGGLGLRLCAEIGRALGLALEVKTEAGRGTEFSFVLPVAAAPEAAPKEALS